MLQPWWCKELDGPLNVEHGNRLYRGIQYRIAKIAAGCWEWQATPTLAVKGLYHCSGTLSGAVDTAKAETIGR